MSIAVEPSNQRGQSGHDDMPYRQHFDNEAFADEDDQNQYDDETDDKDERLVVRIVPKFIDYAIFFVQLTILGSYFYVAYIWGKLDDV